MADGTGIEWTDATWNPIRGCSRVSEGCRHCYAETVAARFSGRGQPYEGLARFVDRPDGSSEARWTGKVRLVEEALTLPLRWRRPRRIFVNSMSDLFHEKVPDEWIDRIFAVMALSPNHTFQILTKRPERMRAYFAETWQPAPARDFIIGGEKITIPAETRPGDRWDQVERAIDELTADKLFEQDRFWTSDGELIGRPAWPRQPMPNVWLGVSIEDQVTADARIPILLKTPAAVRFVSAEPLLGMVDLVRAGGATNVHHHPDNDLSNEATRGAIGAIVRAATRSIGVPMLDWVIVGGESGPRARLMHPEWASLLRYQCEGSGIPFFFKQWGEWVPRRALGYLPPGIDIDRFDYDGMNDAWRVGKKIAGRVLDGRTHDAFPAANG